MSAAKQLLVALKGLHDIGLVHRDLNEGALMWEMPHYNTATEYEWLGRPRKIFLGDHLWKRGELVEQVTVPLGLVGSKLYLGDFGLVIKDGTSVRTKQQSPYPFCAPERLHGADPSLASDMWSYMCLFATLYFGCGVFYGNGGKLTGTSWVNQLGAMPKQWKGKFWSPDWYDDWYDDQITLNPDAGLRRRFVQLRPETSQAERDLALSVLHKGFSYLPERRITAKQLLQDPSFKALMDMY
ncbi:hypothetical protein LARI1_G008541 [Lachnellula arida]|uniref:Protein kinase domain-containing protein n=1 Tax=Lachnellula arida TaxID=1316785 RepID=A0A8T9B043_9HELO|nr:hypothetical protein LARI1_G008541 [Lachnellula arida]